MQYPQLGINIGPTINMSPGTHGDGYFFKFATLSNVTENGNISPELTYLYPYGEVYLPAYHAISPGFDAIVHRSGEEGSEYYIEPVVILNADGTLPNPRGVAASNDLIQFVGTWDGTLTADQLVSNDVDGSGVGFVKKISVIPDLTWVRTYDAGWWAQGIDVGGGTQFSKMGSVGFHYEVTNLFDEISNRADVTVEWFGGQTDRGNLVGSNVSETIDFAASSQSVGIHGLGGDDIIRGSQASDTLYGEDGADRIGGKGGDDVIYGGNGNDTIFGDAGNDTIDGGADNDTLWGGDGNDIIRGGLGNDQVYGENGDDQIGGKAGNDAVRGGAGNDTIWGDDGNDALYGDEGNDNLNGGSGDDFLTGGLGADRMRGESGVDTFVFIRGEAQGDTILDFEGAGVVGGDKIEFRGYGAGASVHQVSGDTWQIDAAGISETFKIAGVANLAKVDFYFT